MTDREFWRKRSLFGKIEASQQARLDFFVAKPAFRTTHDAIFIRVGKTMAVTTDPAGAASGIAEDQSVIRDITDNHRSRSDKTIPAQRYAADDSGIGADSGSPPYERSLVEGVTLDLGTRIGDVREDAGGAKKDIVFNYGSAIDRNVILHLDVAADDNALRHVTILAETASGADASVLHNVTEMPDRGAGADAGRFMHDGGGIDVVVCQALLLYA